MKSSTASATYVNRDLSAIRVLNRGVIAFYPLVVNELS